MNENAKAWLEDLRTTRAGQAQCTLTDGMGNYCCLGRACVLAEKAGIGHWEDRKVDDGTFHDFVTKSGSSSSVLPLDVMKWLGLHRANGGVKAGIPGLIRFSSDVVTSALSSANDRGATFKEIADAIEKNEQAFFECEA